MSPTSAHQWQPAMHLYFYLDESGPFDDRDRDHGESWPVSLVGGIVSERPLTNERLRPVLDRIEAFGNHGLTDRDLHAMELRRRLGAAYHPWMTHAIQALREHEDSVRAVCFRSSEHLTLDDPDTTYLTVLVEGFVRVVPTLIERYGHDLDRITLVLENRRRMGGQPAYGGRGRLRPGDDAVERHYVSLEDYASRLRTRLRVELIRRGLTAEMHLVSRMRIRISDPAEDKALNWADFICHHCRYGMRGGADGDLYAEAIEPMTAFDVALVLHQGYDAAVRMREEGRLGEALFALAEVLAQSPSGEVRRLAFQQAEALFAEARRLAPYRLLHELEGYLAAVQQRIAYGQHLHEDSDDDTLATADANLREEVRAHLDLFDRWCRDELAQHEQPNGPRDGAAGERPRVLAWRWGLFRSQKERLTLANDTGDLAAAAEAIERARPLVARFGRSATQQPEVLAFLREMSRTDGLALRLEAGLGRLERLTQFYRETEAWWGLQLPDVLPGISEELDAEEIYSEPLGHTLRLQAWLRWVTADLLADVDAAAAAARREQAVGEWEAALGEFSFPRERMAVAADLATAYVAHGRLLDALRTLFAPTGSDVETLVAVVPSGRFDPLATMLEPLAYMAEPADAVRALLHVWTAVADAPAVRAFVDLDAEWADGLRRALTPSRVREAVQRVRRIPATSPLQAIALAGRLAAWLAAVGETATARDAYQRALRLRPDEPAASLALDWPLLRLRLAALRLDGGGKRRAAAVRETRDAVAVCRQLAKEAGSDAAVLGWLQRAGESLDK